MAPYYVEVWKPDRRDVVVLEAQRVTVGKATSNDIPIRSDPTVSRLHAVLERFPAGWCIRDLDSHNGTFVNGRRVLGEHRLESGDEIRVGQTRLMFRVEGQGREETATQAAEAAPALTIREREVLMALCRPLFAGDVFTEPASIREMANELVVTEAAIKQHLLHLYDKFGIHDETARRRVRLANEAIRRGAVSLAELRAKRTAPEQTQR
jgi:pSer/pThr/pTyr-binding forkhead associated (FHA) protein